MSTNKPTNMITRVIKRFRELINGDPKGSFKYRGFKVFLGKGSSLLAQIKQSAKGIYEEEELAVLKTFVNKKSLRNIIDVGSNIGLFSLNMLKEFNLKTIYAFEPGPSQFKSFSETIQANNLSDRIILNNVALSNLSGFARFSTHQEFDNSGDGFIDTGRAGEGSVIEVETQTLDTYWENMGNIPIDFIKIDTEGAELWVLQGAKKIISKNSPLLLLEIFHLNLLNYEHTSSDIFNLLQELNYDLYDQTLSRISCEELEKLHHTQGIFYAKPK